MALGSRTLPKPTAQMLASFPLLCTCAGEEPMMSWWGGHTSTQAGWSKPVTVLPPGLQPTS